MLKLNARSLDWALQHIIKEGDTDIFPQPFEYLAIKHDWDRLRDWMNDQNVLEWPTRPHRRCLAPKHRYGFRVSTQLDPLDSLVLASLIYEVGEELESHRIPAAESIVHSYRFSPTGDGQLFTKDWNYGTFQRKSRELLDSGQYPWVVIADIADFYPRIYAHRLENALRQATTRGNHVTAIMNLLAQWNEHVSYGIPVGPAPSRLLAEVAIDDVDRALLSEGAIYLRFIDDFRIFCKSKAEAYVRLAFLANTLFENHGLTLQQHKTGIMTADQFRKARSLTDEETELQSLTQKFYELAETLGLDDLYGYIDYDSLDPDQKKAVDSLNLEELLKEQLSLQEIDIPLTRFTIRRLGQLDNSEVTDQLFKASDLLYPVIKDVAEYLIHLRSLDDEQKKAVGEGVANLLENKVASHLEFHRMWLLNVFARSGDWGCEGQYAKLFNEATDLFSQRKLVLALGRSNQDHWFRTRKRSVFDFSPWLRRAILAAGGCLPADERKHWYHSLQTRLDPLELSVVNWAKSKPVRTS